MKLLAAYGQQHIAFGMGKIFCRFLFISKSGFPAFFLPAGKEATIEADEPVTYIKTFVR